MSVMQGKITSGALVGWKWNPTGDGLVLTMQLAASVTDFQENQFEVVQIALNDRQLRSLARDCGRMTEKRGLELWARPKWWRRLFARLRDLPLR